MMIQTTEVGGRPAIAPRALHWPRAATQPWLPVALRRVVVIVLLVLALCGMAAHAQSTGLTATPPDGPAPGLDL